MQRTEQPGVHEPEDAGPGERLRPASVAAKPRNAPVQAQAGVRLRLAVNASTLLVSSLDYDAVLVRLVEAVVPLLADRAAVYILEADGALRMRADAELDRPGETSREDSRGRSVPSADAAITVLQVMEAGRAAFCSGLPELASRPRAGRTTAKHRTGVQTAIVVPLLARDTPLGAMLLARTEPGHRYRPADLELAQEFADWVAPGIDSARIYRDAVNALHAQERILSSLSHDLRTPLTTVRGMAQILLREAKASDSVSAAHVTSRLGLVDRAVTQMTSMIDASVDLARLQARQALVLNRQPVDLLSLVRRLADELQESSDDKIRIEAPSRELIGDWDVARLERVLVSILATIGSDGAVGRDISLSIRRREVDRGWAEIVVRDRATPIKAPLEAISPAWEANSAAGPRSLILSPTAARQIIEQHGGTLTYEYENDGGLTFRVDLPLTYEQRSA